MTGEGFRAGAGRTTITPSLTVPRAGWGAQTHLFADGVETGLCATARGFNFLGDGLRNVLDPQLRDA